MELNACKFCSSSNIDIERNTEALTTYRVYCIECGARRPLGNTKAGGGTVNRMIDRIIDAINKWNQNGRI